MAGAAGGGVHAAGAHDVLLAVARADEVAGGASFLQLRFGIAKIFQRDRGDNGLRRRASGVGTRGPSHGSSCQSPRIQRRRRLTSAE